MFTVKETPTMLQHTYPSLATFADAQMANAEFAASNISQSFSGVSTFAEAVQCAKDGIPESGLRALDASKSLAAAAMRSVKTFEMSSVFDTSGAYVDMGRYVTGEPECMVDPIFETVPVTKPVVTLVSNVAASAAISTTEIEARGRLIVALVKAIETSGRSTELYADTTVSDSWSTPKHHFRISVKVKAASAPLDMGAVMYAYSHPSMLRVLSFNAMHAMPEKLHGKFTVGSTYAYPTKGEVSVADSYGPDAVYLSSVRMGDNAEATVTRILTDLGIA